MENLFSLLRQDHARLRDFTRDLGTRNTRDLARQWAIHFQSEETFLFPRLADDAEMRPLLRQLSETHALVREDFRDLFSEEAGEAQAEALCHTLREAVELEEKSLFRKAERILSPDESAALAREVQDFREEVGQGLAAA